MSEELRRIARTQFMLVTRPQALAAGVSDKTIRRRLSSDAWVRMYPGVYDTSGGTAADTPERRALAATLAAGAGAVASHELAAAVWRLTEHADRVDVIVPPNRCPTTRGLIVHRRTLRSSERTTYNGVPLTAPMTTVAGLAEIQLPQLEHVLDEALRRDLVDGRRMLAYLNRDWNRSRPGTAELRMLLRDRAFGVPDSWLETTMARIVRIWRLPPPQRGYWVELGGRRHPIDFAYPDAKVAIEADSSGFHGSLAATERDKHLDMLLQRAGWLVLRFTYRQATYDESYVAFEIAKALGLRPTGWTKPVTSPARARGGWGATRPRARGKKPAAMAE